WWSSWLCDFSLSFLLCASVVQSASSLAAARLTETGKEAGQGFTVSRLIGAGQIEVSAFLELHPLALRCGGGDALRGVERAHRVVAAMQHQQRTAQPGGEVGSVELRKARHRPPQQQPREPEHRLTRVTAAAEQIVQRLVPLPVGA